MKSRLSPGEVLYRV